MATEIIHGAPGSYKTSALLSLYLREAVKENRVVITNIRGLDNVNLIKKTFDLKQSTFSLINVGFDKDGFDRLARFFHWAPQNAIILMDEGQRVYPSRLRSFSEFDYQGDNDDFDRPSTVELAFDTHRHNGWDIYISTPNIAKVNKEIRQVCEFAYRHKNLAGLVSLPYFKDRFKRVKHDAENSGKSLSYQISASLEKIDKKVFCLYDSTQTGKAKNIKSPSLFKNPKFLLAFVCIILGLGSLLSNFISTGTVIISDPNLPVIDSTTENQDLSLVNVQAQSFDEKTPHLSSGDDSDGHSHKDYSHDDYLTHFFNAIQYHHSTITYFSDGVPFNTFIFKTSDGHTDSTTLGYLGIKFTNLNNYFLITYLDHQRLIPSGDPNYDHFHYESSQSHQLTHFQVEQPTEHTIFGR